MYLVSMGLSLDRTLYLVVFHSYIKQSHGQSRTHILLIKGWNGKKALYPPLALAHTASDGKFCNHEKM